MQVVDTALVFVSVYLMLLCIEVFAELQTLDLANDSLLNPSSNHIVKEKGNSA